MSIRNALRGRLLRMWLKCSCFGFYWIADPVFYFFCFSVTPAKHRTPCWAHVLESYHNLPVPPSTHTRHSNYLLSSSCSFEDIVVSDLPLVLFSFSQMDALTGLLAVVKVLLGEHVELTVQPACLVPNKHKQKNVLIISTFSVLNKVHVWKRVLNTGWWQWLRFVIDSNEWSQRE